jgi:arylsulfatase A
MKRINQTILGVLCAFVVQAPAAKPHSDGTERSPNIVFILADDMGYGDCSAYNSQSKVHTPNIDRLAAEGLLFTDAHSASATCTASRYGLLTGINPARRGVVNGICALGPVLEEKEVTVAKLLRSQGYVTSMVGKWHLGFEMKPAKPRPIYDFAKPFQGGPLDHGFDSFLGLRQAVSGAPYFYIRDRKVEVKPTETTKGTKNSAKAAGKDSRTAYGSGAIAPGFVPEECNARLNDEVVQTIRQHAAKGDQAKPLFLYYAMLQPHTPWLPEERFVGQSEAGPYGDYLVQMDHEVGKVLKALRETGLDRDTLIIFTSDNGAMWPRSYVDATGHRANGPLAGGKARPEEGGHRVPFIARWPGRVPAGARTGATINHTDFLATCAGLLEINLKQAAPEAAQDSHSFLNVLNNPATTHERTAMSVTARSFRYGDWKLNFKPARSAGPEAREVDEASLYNLAEDLGESTDLSGSQPRRTAQLFAAFREYYSTLKLKPLAEQVQASRVAAKTRSKTKNRPARKSQTTESDLDEIRRQRTALLKQLDLLLTPQQKQAQADATKKALAKGKGGVALRKAMDAALKLTPDQKNQFSKLRQEISDLTRQLRN